MEYSSLPGDIFLCDSDRIGAKMVKFFMQSPTAFLQLWRWIFRTLEPVRYYHAGIIRDNQQMIEQQSKVQYGETQKILSRKITIYRKKSLTMQQRLDVVGNAVEEIGEGYGIVSIIGKTLTWLTGVPLFEKLVNWQDTEICVCRVAKWYEKTNGEKFGVESHRDITTKIMDEYCANNNDWEVVYFND